jgi:ABC-type sulfate/molybdate transport systems ATPase subunit
MRAPNVRLRADPFVVLRNDAIVQSGPAPDIFHKPATALVARFLGIAARTSLLSHHLTRYL